MDLQLEGKVALVTGGSEGIGNGIARALAREGCDVAICARRKGVLEAAAAEIRMKTRLLGLVLGVALASVAWVEAGHDGDRVLVSAPPLARADAIWMAQKQRFFTEEGVSVVVKWLPKDRDALSAFQQGSGDFVVVSDVPALTFWQASDGAFVVLAALARDADGYVALARADIAGPEALRTRRVATRLGSTSAWFLAEYLRAHGMSERDIALQNTDPDAALSWDLEQGDVAAFFVREPYATRALARHGDKIRRLATARGYAQGYLVIGARRKHLEEHPGVAERLLRALDRGRRYAAEHGDEVVDFGRAMFQMDDAAPIKADYASTERLVALDRVTLDDFQRLGRWMREAGIIKATFDPRAFFDPRPLRAAAPDRVAAEVNW